VEFQKCYSDHSVFIHRTSPGIVILNGNVNILLTKSDVAGIVKAKEYMKIVTKDMGRPRYFLGIENCSQ